MCLFMIRQYLPYQCLELPTICMQVSIGCKLPQFVSMGEMLHGPGTRVQNLIWIWVPDSVSFVTHVSV